MRGWLVLLFVLIFAGSAGSFWIVVAALNGDTGAVGGALFTFTMGAAALVGSEIGASVSLYRMAKLLRYRDGVSPPHALGVAAAVCALVGRF